MAGASGLRPPRECRRSPRRPTIRTVFVADVFGSLHPHSMRGAGHPQQATMSVDVTGRLDHSDHDLLNGDRSRRRPARPRPGRGHRLRWIDRQACGVARPGSAPRVTSGAVLVDVACSRPYLTTVGGCLVALSASRRMRTAFGSTPCIASSSVSLIWATWVRVVTPAPTSACVAGLPMAFGRSPTASAAAVSAAALDPNRPK